MKKIALLALVIAASATFSTADAKKKKDKKQTAATEQPVSLKTSTDSVSYAAGMALTQGLVGYLQQRMGVDTAYMEDFVKGYEQYVKSNGDPKLGAYAAGMDIGKQVSQQMLPRMVNDFKDSPDSIDQELFHRGFKAALTGDSTVMSAQAGTEYFRTKSEADKKAKQEKLYGENRKAGEQFLAENKTKEGVKTTESGLQYKVLTQGTGETPKKTDKVKVKYEGKLIDGTVFDSSYSRKDSTNTFRADQVIKGWTEALTMMPVGSKWQLFIPQELAYGEREAGKIKPFSALIFTVDLVGIEGNKAADTKVADPKRPTMLSKRKVSKKK